MIKVQKFIQSINQFSFNQTPNTLIPSSLGYIQFNINKEAIHPFLLVLHLNFYLILSLRYLLMGNNQCCQEPTNQQYKSQIPVNIEPNLNNEQHKPSEQLKHNEQLIPKQNGQHLTNIVVVEQNSKEQKNKQSNIYPAVNNHPSQVEKSFQKFNQSQKGKDSKIQNGHQKIEIPELNSLIKGKIQAEKYYQDKFEEQVSVKKYGQQLYSGYVDQNNYPHGFGKMYKPDGSVFIGQFEHGKAQGEGVFLMPDGLTYKGNFHNNQAQGIGKYEYEGLVYSGHFSNNKFHGAGEEVTADYQYSGEYSEGNKVNGVFKWKDSQKKNYIYTGHFNSNNLFHGTGTLQQPNGVYTGQFVDGHKQGKGIYKNANGLRYEGEYVKGKKQGKGTLYNYNNTIAYQGQFHNDMPHGKGIVYDAQGNKNQTVWSQGIDSAFL